jgi:hypothetical protein
MHGIITYHIKVIYKTTALISLHINNKFWYNFPIN